MSYDPWWLTPEFSEHRCTGPAKDRSDHRCHNLAVSERMCRAHLRLAGKPIPCRCRCGCAQCSDIRDKAKVRR